MFLSLFYYNIFVFTPIFISVIDIFYTKFVEKSTAFFIHSEEGEGSVHSEEGESRLPAAQQLRNAAYLLLAVFHTKKNMFCKSYMN